MTKNKETSDFDFGFSTEVDVVDRKEVDDIVNHEVIDAREKLKKMRKAIQPLLDNFKKNPENDFIRWPNRIEKIDEFEKHLDTLMK